tara:strand:+ start:1043 stop:1699 length:657 start_codon:yes stop_codon:yes gene_type:complete
MFSSAVSWNTFKINLMSFNDNIFLANITYIGFLIVVIERVVEVVKTNYMEPEKLRLLAILKETESQQIIALRNKLDDDRVKEIIKNLKPEDFDETHELEYIVLRSLKGVELTEYTNIKQKCKDAKFALALHANKTRTTILRISLLIAGTLSCLGCANFLYPLLDESLFIKNLYIPEPYLIDGLSAVITSWAIAAGSDGWNTVTNWAGKAINNKKGTLS